MSKTEKLLDYFITVEELSLTGLSKYTSKQWKKLRTDTDSRLTNNQIMALQEAVKMRLIGDQSFEQGEEIERLKARIKELSDTEKKKIDYHEKESERLYTISQKNIIRMISNLKFMTSDLDICFCIDGTGSMQNLILNVSECIVRVSEIVSLGTGMKSRYALVVYRDYCDGDLRHQFWDFNTSAHLEEILKTIVACGGGDTAEDCFGGLMTSINKINWKANSKIICWMCDAPQHGIQYSRGCSDHYPDGDPEITSDQIFAGLKDKGITLVFCRLTNNTDLMMEQLSSEIAPYGSHMLVTYNFEGEIEKFLSESICRVSHLSNFRKFFMGSHKKHTIIDVDWNPNDVAWKPVEKCNIISFEPYVKNIRIDPLIDLIIDHADTTSRNALIKFTNNPVAKGETRLAYKAIVTNLDKSELRMILKESLYETISDPNKILRVQAQIQTIAMYLAERFNKRLKESNITTQRKVEYIPVELVKITTGADGRKLFALEHFIDGEYLKFNNNNGAVSANGLLNPLMQTFTHFTCDESKGILMVTDIQGVIQHDRYLLTDPAIHTIEDSLLPDMANLGTQGMESFFSTHICNPICKNLKLRPFKEISDVCVEKARKSRSKSPARLPNKDSIDLSGAISSR